jgi:hypothetical protein
LRAYEWLGDVAPSRTRIENPAIADVEPRYVVQAFDAYLCCGILAHCAEDRSR